MIVLHFVKTTRIVNISIQLARITICTGGESVENSLRNTWSVWQRKKGRKRWIMSPFPSSPSRVKSIQFFFFLFSGLFPCSSEPIESKKEEWRRKKSDCPVCWTGSADSAGSASNTSGAYQPLKRKIPI